MKVNTRDFGPVNIEPNDIFEFPEGIYGFEEEKKFALFTKVFEDVPFLYLQSMDNIVPCFLVFEPSDLYHDYKPSLSDEDLKACNVESPDELVFLVIANIPDSLADMSINIKSPLVLNPKTNKGRQVILQNADYSVRYQPFMQNSQGGV